MVSYNVNRIDLDVNLWLSRFQATDSVRRSAWSLPDQPFPADQPETDPVNFLVTDVAHQLQTRSMRSNVLHYIDHPALGVLVEMRPYQLPDNLSLD